MSLSRRNLLKNGLLATASLSILDVNRFVEGWHRADDQQFYDNEGSAVIRLSHNENPYGPSEKARAAIIEAIQHGNRYPRAAITDLCEAIAAKEQLSPEQVLITAGSTELLGVIGLMAGVHKGKVISSNPTFDFMCSYAGQFSAEWVKVPLTGDHKYNLAGINEKVDQHTRLVFVCNPNNPTGTEHPSSVLKPFCQTLSARCLVYVDEAYIELSREGMAGSLANMTLDNPNLVVGRTFSKVYGLAGMRVGYAIAHPQTIREITRHLQGRTVSPSVCSVAAAMASLDDSEFVDYCMRMNDRGKEIVYRKFEQWGVEYIPSSTNFVFFRTDKFSTSDVRTSLADDHVMIRNYSDVPGWARVSIGTLEEMEKFTRVAAKYLS